MTIYSVCQLPSGYWIHAQHLPHVVLQNSVDYINVIGVDAVDHIDAYIQAAVPVEKVHEAYRAEVAKRKK